MYEFINRAVEVLKKIVPGPVVRILRKPYHLLLAVFMARAYGHPARQLTVIAVTGTKGKSSVAEMLFSILRAAGHSTALISTIRFAVGDHSEPNRYKMTLQGRGFTQAFMRQAIEKGCTHLVIEVTSESVVQYRHLGLELDALIFTNLQKEHLESHGSMERYFRAKYRIGEALTRSQKRPRSIIANADDAYGKRFLQLPVENHIPFSLSEAEEAEMNESGVSFTYRDTRFTLSLPGEFNIANALAAIKAAEAFGVPLTTSVEALSKLSRIPGRAERIESGQNFLAIVDYAHTPDSLLALYSAYPNREKICVLGNTGGGRDTWKRPEMGSIADEYCREVILTNEDPYDEDPRAILDAMARGMKRAPSIILDRREAIRTALARAQPNDAVLITGKGTDPFIMGAHGEKTPWSDAEVVREELALLPANPQ